MILIMDSKAFFDTFVMKEEEDTVLEANYLIASKRIRFSQKYADRIMTVPFYPDDSTIMKFTSDQDYDLKSNSEYMRAYEEQLKAQEGFIAHMIIASYKEPKGLAIILTTRKERKALGFVEVLQRWIFDRFDVYIPEYTTIARVSDYTPFKIRPEQYIKAKKRLVKYEKRRKKKLMKTERGQLQYFSSLNPSELKSLLKQEGVYTKGSTKSEMIEDAMTFLT